MVSGAMRGVRFCPCTDTTDAAGRYTEVRDLLDYLERSSSGTATRARLELLFTILLDQFRPARALPTVLRAEPGLLNGKIHADLIIRSPVSAADADHAAATQFRRWSRQVTAQWRTAALLRQLAAASEERARNHERFSREILD